MSNAIYFPPINEVGIVSNDEGSIDIVLAPGNGQRIFIQKVTFSVVEPAIGGGGICQLRDTDGNDIYKFNVDGVKDIPLNFGHAGLQVGLNLGLQFVVNSAATKNATVQVALSGYKSFQATKA